MIEKHLQDCDLSSFFISPDLSSAEIELSSNYNGDTLAKIVCKRLLIIQLNSALAFDHSKLPALVGEFQVTSLDRESAVECLRNHNYGFERIGSSFSDSSATVWWIRIEGGEIECQIIAMDCDFL